jgi:predicted transcriptional regulator
MAKYTLNLDPVMERVLEELAQHQGVTKSTVIRRAVGLMKYIADERRDGARLKLEESDGTVKELVLEGDLR